LAKALTEREALKLEIIGRADPEHDREGLKRVALERALRIEKQKDLQKQSGEGRSLARVTLSPEEIAVYLPRVYRDAKFPKPRNLIGLQKNLPLAEMEKLLLSHASASDDDLLELARRRAETVQTWLVEQGKAPIERLFLLPPQVVERTPEARGGVRFSLR